MWTSKVTLEQRCFAVRYYIGTHAPDMGRHPPQASICQDKSSCNDEILPAGRKTFGIRDHFVVEFVILPSNFDQNIVYPEKICRSQFFDHFQFLDPENFSDRL